MLENPDNNKDSGQITDQFKKVRGDEIIFYGPSRESKHKSAPPVSTTLIEQ